MKPKPAQDIRQPSYPTRREVLAGAASFALFSLTGCNFAFAESEEGKVTVAPIFEHGKGRGAAGCVVVSPPVFLSEEEGMQILREELAKHGIQLKAGSVLEGARIPHRIRVHELETEASGKRVAKDTIVESEKQPNPLKLDGVDPEKHIAVEFVSERRYYELGGPNENYDSDDLDDPDAKKDDSNDATGVGSGYSTFSTVHSFDFKGTAEFVAAQVKKQGKDQVFFGVFYDPLMILPWPKRPENGEYFDRKAELQKREKQIKEESTKQLRLQAQDFVAWLKEQKAIQ